MDSRRNNLLSDHSFSKWALEWLRLARQTGSTIPSVEPLIEQVVELWKQTIPGMWRRGQDARLTKPEHRYCRGNRAPDALRRGEHSIEYDLLQPNPATRTAHVMGATLIDGVNAVPLAKDADGRRAGNVEADMLLLVHDRSTGYRLELVEVKVSANDAWFAAVENLRQLRLLAESTETMTLFQVRQPGLRLPAELPFSGLVLAPPAFYSARGKKKNAVAPAQELLDRMRTEVGIDARLACWEAGVIEPLANGGR